MQFTETKHVDGHFIFLDWHFLVKINVLLIRLECDIIGNDRE